MRCYECGTRFAAEWDERPRRRRPRLRDELVCPTCQAACEPLAPECERCGQSFQSADLRDAIAQLQAKRMWFQILCFVFGLMGLGCFLAGTYLAIMNAGPTRYYDPTRLWIGGGLLLGGHLVFWVGIAFGVAFKRTSLADIWLGLLGVLGLIILMCLHDQKARRLKRMKNILEFRRTAPRHRDAEPRRAPPPLPDEEILSVLPAPPPNAIQESPIPTAAPQVVPPPLPPTLPAP
jgi:hypothetical protein